MKTIEQIHRQNLAALVEQYGSVSVTSEIIGCSPSQFSQWLNGSQNSGTGKSRGISARSCRKIELACQKPNGWMDVEHSPSENKKTPMIETQPRLVMQWISLDEVELLSDYRTVSDDDKIAIRSLADSLEKIAQPDHNQEPRSM